MTKKLYSFAAITVLALTGCAPTSQISGASGQQTSAMQGNSASIGPSKAGGACGDNTGNCVSLLFTGDFLMHNMLWDQAQRDALAQGKSGLDFGPLIAEQKPYLDRTDLAVCQTETPVAPLEVSLCVLPNFQCPTPNTHSGLRSGLGCLYDSQQPCHRPGGAEGLERTYRTVQQNGMGVTGTNLTPEEALEPDIFTTSNGAKVVVITGTYGLNGNIPEHDWQMDRLDPDTMIAKAKKAREQGAELVIANVHAGDEYVHEPNQQQVTTGHKLVDSGEFDLIVGEHVHAVQPIEKYRDTWIVYGMGNNLTELSPTYEANNEGIVVNPIFKRQEDGTWYVKDLRWVSSKIVDTPNYRYCIPSPNPTQNGLHR